MDEPFQGLDYGIRMEMVNMLLEIWKIKKPGALVNKNWTQILNITSV